MTKFLSGENLAKKITQSLKAKKIRAHLAVILVGQEPQSIAFVGGIIKKAKEIRAKVSVLKFSEKTKQEEIINLIKQLNKDRNIHGIVIGFPLPKNLNTGEILKQIEPKKDVDRISPPTPKAVAALLKDYGIELKGKKIVLIGKGRLVGGPLFKMLKEKRYNVVACDKKTKEIKKIAQQADILISATGVKGLVKKDWVKEGAMVIDCAQDVDRAVEQKASYITPKTGGIGPLTVVFLFENLVKT